VGIGDERAERDGRAVQCPDHGQVGPAFVCRHLFEQVLHNGFTPIGFFEPDVQAEEPNGWCRECEIVRAREGGWNDASEAFAGVKFICSGCFARIRSIQRAAGQRRSTWQVLGTAVARWLGSVLHFFHARVRRRPD